MCRAETGTLPPPMSPDEEAIQLIRIGRLQLKSLRDAEPETRGNMLAVMGHIPPSMAGNQEFVDAFIRGVSRFLYVGRSQGIG